MSVGANVSSGIADESETRIAWERQSDEPEQWYLRFARYRDLGPTRTLNRAYAFDRTERTVVRTVSPLWFDAFQDWHWRERAALWDEAQRAAAFRALAEPKERDRAERILVLKAARGKLIAAMQATTVEDDRYESIMVGLTRVNEQLRKESED